MDHIKMQRSNIIQNAIRTPDGTILCSKYTHDCVIHEDKNGKTYGVDGGKDYFKVIGEFNEIERLYIKTNDNFDHLKENIIFGTYGLDENGNSLFDNWIRNKPLIKKISLSSLELNFVNKLSKSYVAWFKNKPKLKYILVKDMTLEHITAALKHSKDNKYSFNTYIEMALKYWKSVKEMEE